MNSICKETIVKKGLDKKLLRKNSKANTYSGWLLSCMKKARDEENFDLAILLESLYNKYEEYNKSEKVIIESWKGKSGLKLIEYPDRFMCIHYKKADKGEEPKEIKKEVLKSDLNDLIIVINHLKDIKKIPTSEIAEKYYGMKWDKVFSNRKKHTYLVYMLNILEQKKKINYSRAGFTEVIKDLDYFSLK